MSRAWVYKESGDYEKSLADFLESIRCSSINSRAYYEVALILAACPEDKIRNGPEALKCALKACEIGNWQQTFHLPALSAAYAEVGNFKKALEVEQKYHDANKRAESEPAVEDDIPDRHYFERMCTESEQRMALYRAHKPWREKRPASADQR